MKRALFLTNPYAGYRMDGVRRHDQSWSDLNSRDEFRAFTGIASAVLMGAAMWAALACFVVILWGVMA
jgi:hypothetical protein